MMTVFLPLNGSLFSTPPLVNPLRFSLDLLNSVHATLFLTTLLWIICRLVASQVHDWVVYKLGSLVDSVGHRVKIHKITPSTDKD